MTTTITQMQIRCVLVRVSRLPKGRLIQYMELASSIIELNFTFNYVINIIFLTSLHLKSTYQGYTAAFSAQPH